MITASALPRLLNCPASAVLPRAENANEWADSGNDDHAALAADTLAGTLDERLALHVPPGSRVEVAVAFDVSTGAARIIGENIGRAYGDLAPFEIAGSIDVLGIVGDAVVVLDWKTGFKDVEPAATNGQLRFYALAACRALGRDRAVLRIVYTQTGRCDEAEMDALDLAGFAAEVEGLHARVAALKAGGGPYNTREGSWCRHCASKHACPSKRALLVQIASGGLASVGATEMTSEIARTAALNVLAAEQLVADAKKRLDAYVTTNGPIELSPGRFYGRYVRPGNEKVDGAVALRVIREVCGELVEPFADEALEVKTSKAAIKRAAKAVGEPQLEKAVLGRIRTLGGIASAPDTFPIGEFNADKNEAAPIDLDEVNALLKDAG